MVDDVNPELRAELLAALAILAPQTRGLRDWVTVSITEALRFQIELQIESRERRRDLIQAVLERLDSTNAMRDELEADGYPELPRAELPPDLHDELRREETDIDAAVGIFEQRGPATAVAIDLGTPAEKPL